MRYRLTKRWSLFGVLCAITVTINFPIIVLVANSFQTTEQMLATTSVFPHSFTSPTSSSSAAARRSGPS